MESLIYFSVLLICFLGILIGVLISYFAREELKDGKKYFILSKNALFALTIFFLIYFLNIELVFNLFISLTLAAILFKFKIKESIVYVLMGLIFYFSSLNEVLFKINASLIFLYGIFAGSLFMEKNIKLSKMGLIKNLFVNYVWFFVLGAVLGVF